MSGEKTMYYMQDIMTHSREESRKDFNKVMEYAKAEDRQFCFLVMELKSTREVIGKIGYTVSERSPKGKLVNAGYFSLPQYWGNGYMSEAFAELIRFAFEEDNVYRLYCSCIKENVGSEKVMEKCGLIKEGEFKEYELHDGKLKDRAVYRLLKDEWLAKNK